MGNFLQDLDNLICAAIEESYLEDRLHAVLVCILTAFKDRLQTDARTTISCSIQARTVDRRLYDELQSLRAFLTTIPDGGFFLHLRNPDLEPYERTRALMQFEVKRLLVKKSRRYTDANRFTAWGGFAADGQVEAIFLRSIPQLLLQGFCALHAYQGQDTIYIAHLVGIYLTLLRFDRPVSRSKNLPSLPRNANYKACKKRDQKKGREEENLPEYKVGDATIAATLFPEDKSEHHPKVVFADEPIVSWDGNGDIDLTNACRYLLSLTHEQASDWLLGSQPSVIFDLPPNVPFTMNEARKDDYQGLIEQWLTTQRQPVGDDAFLSGSETEGSVELDSPFVPNGNWYPSQAIGMNLRVTQQRTGAFQQAQETRQLNAHDPFRERSPSPGPQASSASLV